jgi:hypothetical protein
MTRRQFGLFTQTLPGFRRRPRPATRLQLHGRVQPPDFALDAVRCGTPPTAAVAGHRERSWLRSVTRVKTVEAGATVGYGAT